MPRSPAPPAARRLRASPNFAFALSPDGRPFVAKQTEPYVQYWLSERERQLLAAFSGRQGATVDDALARCSVTGGDGAAVDPRRLRRAVQGLLDAGVLADLGADPSRYDARIVDAYLRHRPFPPENCAQIVQRGGVGSDSAVLDLAGGPGDLALQLAQHSAEVSLMDWSRAFLRSAAARARRQGLQLRTVHESCNRLLYDDGSYDVVTVSQALHWLDDVAVCRGVLRVLRPQGHFFVVHSAFDVPASHPLAHVLGHRSVLGHKPRTGYAREVQALHERVGGLLAVLGRHEVQRVDLALPHAAPLHSAGVQRFQQRRPLGLGFVQGLLTQQHLESAGLDPAAFWADVQARCARASPAQLMGTHDWALLHFRRGDGSGARPRSPRGGVRRIGCTAP